MKIRAVLVLISTTLIGMRPQDHFKISSAPIFKDTESKVVRTDWIDNHTLLIRKGCPGNPWQGIVVNTKGASAERIPVGTQVQSLDLMNGSQTLLFSQERSPIKKCAIPFLYLECHDGRAPTPHLYNKDSLCLSIKDGLVHLERGDKTIPFFKSRGSFLMWSPDGSIAGVIDHKGSPWLFKVPSTKELIEKYPIGSMKIFEDKPEPLAHLNTSLALIPASHRVTFLSIDSASRFLACIISNKVEQCIGIFSIATGKLLNHIPHPYSDSVSWHPKERGFTVSSCPADSSTLVTTYMLEDKKR